MDLPGDEDMLVTNIGADELYRNFRGADPSIEPLLRGRGFDVPSPAGASSNK